MINIFWTNCKPLKLFDNKEQFISLYLNNRKNNLTKGQLKGKFDKKHQPKKKFQC